MPKPSVSVIMPNYNHARFLPGAVRALVAQSLPPLDIVLVDDGSTDDSLQVMKCLAAEFPCVRVLVNGTNIGTAASCNRGLDSARGAYLLFAAADDLVLPGLIEIGLEMLRKHPDTAMCCRTYLMYDEDTREVKALDYLWGEAARAFTPVELAEILPGWSIQTQGTIYDRTRFEAAGGIREELVWHGDWFLNHVLAFRYGICYDPGPGTIRREHRGSYSQNGRRDWQRQRRVVRAILELFLAKAQRDVLPHVARAQLLGFFGDELSRLYFSDPALWTSEVLTLALPALHCSMSQGPLRKNRIFENLRDTPLEDFARSAFEGL